MAIVITRGHKADKNYINPGDKVFVGDGSEEKTVDRMTSESTIKGTVQFCFLNGDETAYAPSELETTIGREKVAEKAEKAAKKTSVVEEFALIVGSSKVKNIAAYAKKFKVTKKAAKVAINVLYLENALAVAKRAAAL